MTGILLADVFTGMAMMADIRIYRHSLAVFELINIAWAGLYTGTATIAFFFVYNDFSHLYSPESDFSQKNVLILQERATGI
jgi:hypothetical protein